MNEFYVLMNKGNRGEAVCMPGNIPFSEFNVSQILRNQGLPNKQIVYSPCLGKRFFDFNMITAGLDLISEKVYCLLKDNNITGWEGIPAIIHGYEDLKYYLLTITGRCGSIDKSKTIVVNSTSLFPGKTVKAYQGLFFPEDSWDKRDMFVSEYVNHTFVTEKVKKILEKNRITNINLINTKDYQWLIPDQCFSK